jgi:hypothetical protein
MQTAIEELTGSATYETPGGSPDTAHKLYGRELTVAMKKLLKARWPGVAWSVRESRGTGCGWFHVKWTDGPTSREVSGAVGCFQSSYFDGMIDGYNQTGNGAFLLGGQWVAGSARGINTSRETSPELEAKVLAQLVAKYGHAPTGSFHKGEWWSQYPASNTSDMRNSWQSVMHTALAHTNGETGIVPEEGMW